MKSLVAQFSLGCLHIMIAFTLFGCAHNTSENIVKASSNKVKYQCERFGLVSVEFRSDQQAANVELHKDMLVLPHQPSASGFLYSNGKTSIRGKGQALTLVIGKMAPISCNSFVEK